MRFITFFFLTSFLITNLFLVAGCGIKELDSANLLEKNISQVPVQNNCNGTFNDEPIDSVLTKVENDSAELNLIDSDSGETKFNSEISLNPKWIKRLGDDATFLLNFNQQLNKEKDSFLEAKDFSIQDGTVVSSCQMENDGKITIAFSEPRNVQSNFLYFIESYNSLVEKRNKSYEEKLSDFQKDFRDTDFIINKKSVNKTKQNSLDKKADSDYLKNLYQNRLKYFLNVSRG